MFVVPEQPFPAHRWGPQARVCIAHVATPFSTTIKKKKTRSEAALPWQVRWHSAENWQPLEKLNTRQINPGAIIPLLALAQVPDGAGSYKLWTQGGWAPQLVFDLAEFETEAAVAGVAEERTDRSWLNQKLKTLCVS